jgi:hypothetical protein
MALNLVVTIPFGSHAIGASITDPAEVASVLESNASFVVKVTGPDPEPVPAPKPVPAEPAPFTADKPDKN